MSGKIEYRGFTIEFDQDDCPANPRKENDNLSIFCCAHKKYDLPQEADLSRKASDYTADELEAELREKYDPVYLKRLYMYDHSGVSFSTDNSKYPFNDRWDAGMAGFVLVPKEKAQREYCRNLTADDLAAIDRVVEGEISEYAAYAAGDVYDRRIMFAGVDVAEGWACGYVDFDASVIQWKQEVDAIITSCQGKASSFDPSPHTLQDGKCPACGALIGSSGFTQLTAGDDGSVEGKAVCSSCLSVFTVAWPASPVATRLDPEVCFKGMTCNT